MQKVLTPASHHLTFQENTQLGNMDPFLLSQATQKIYIKNPTPSPREGINNYQQQFHTLKYKRSRIASLLADPFISLY